MYLGPSPNLEDMLYCPAPGGLSLLFFLDLASVPILFQIILFSYFHCGELLFVVPGEYAPGPGEN